MQDLTDAQDRLTWQAEDALNAVVMKQLGQVRRVGEVADRTVSVRSDQLEDTGEGSGDATGARRGGRRWLRRRSATQARQQQAERQEARLDVHVLPLRDRPDGKRRQHSKGGFKTQREAEDARIAAMNAKATGAYVKAEKISARRLPRRRVAAVPPPAGAGGEHVAFVRPEDPAARDPAHRQHPAPAALARRPQQAVPAPPRVRPTSTEPEAPSAPPRSTNEPSRSEPTASRYDQIAEALRAEFECEAKLNKNAVASLIRRGPPATIDPDSVSGLSPRTVRYVHTILHAALKDALRWNRVVRNVSDAATPPSTASAKSTRPKVWTADQLRAFLDHVADSRYLPAWIFLATIRLSPRRVPRPEVVRRRSRRRHRRHLTTGHGDRSPGDREGRSEDEARPPHPPRRRHGRDASPPSVRASRREAATRAGLQRRGLRVLPVGRPAVPPRAILT